MRTLPLLFLIGLAAVLGTAEAVAQQPPLLLSVTTSHDGSSPDSGSGRTGQQNFLIISLRNNSAHAILVPSDSTELYTIEVRDALGNAAPESEFMRNQRTSVEECRKSGNSLCGRKFGHGVSAKLKSGASWQELLDIRRYFDMGRPGKYTISVQRKLPEELGVGVVKSNTITVTVTK